MECGWERGEEDEDDFQPRISHSTTFTLTFAMSPSRSRLGWTVKETRYTLIMIPPFLRSTFYHNHGFYTACPPVGRGGLHPQSLYKV